MIGGDEAFIAHYHGLTFAIDDVAKTHVTSEHMWFELLVQNNDDVPHGGKVVLMYAFGEPGDSYYKSIPIEIKPYLNARSAENVDDNMDPIDDRKIPFDIQAEREGNARITLVDIGRPEDFENATDEELRQALANALDAGKSYQTLYSLKIQDLADYREERNKADIESKRHKEMLEAQGRLENKLDKLSEVILAEVDRRIKTSAIELEERLLQSVREKRIEENHPNDDAPRPEPTKKQTDPPAGTYA